MAEMAVQQGDKAGAAVAVKLKAYVDNVRNDQAVTNDGLASHDGDPALLGTSRRGHVVSAAAAPAARDPCCAWRRSEAGLPSP